MKQKNKKYKYHYRHIPAALHNQGSNQSQHCGQH